MKKGFKCYLTNENVKIGDIVIRPTGSAFEKHVIVGFTKQGVYISKIAMNYSLHKTIYYAAYDYDITKHNIKHYVQYAHFVIVGKYEGDMSQFKQTLYTLNKNTKNKITQTKL